MAKWVSKLNFKASVTVSIDLIGVDRFIDVAESGIVRVLAVETTSSGNSTLINFVSFDVARCVVAGKKSCSVIIRISGKCTSNLSRTIVNHLSEVSNVVARSSITKLKQTFR